MVIVSVVYLLFLLQLEGTLLEQVAFLLRTPGDGTGEVKAAVLVDQLQEKDRDEDTNTHAYT